MIVYHHRAAGWHIRLHQAGDSVDIVNIFEDCLVDFPWRGSTEIFRKQLIQDMIYNTVMVAAEPNAGLIGFMIYGDKTGYVSHLFVAEDWRLCGVGRGFLDYARREAGRPLSLHVDTLNTAAQAAYSALGWRETVSREASHIPGGQVRLISP